MEINEILNVAMCDKEIEDCSKRKNEIVDEVETRKSQFEQSNVKTRDSLLKEIEDFTNEANSIDEKLEKLNELRTNLQSQEDALSMTKQLERCEEKAMEVKKEERATTLLETGKMETRALLSTGKIATPTKVGGMNGLAEVADSIVDDVTAISLVGNGAWKRPYKSADAKAVDVVDGQAIGGTEAEFATVEINPAEVGVYSEISAQVKKLTPVDYENEIAGSSLTALRDAMAEKIVANVKGSAIVDKKVAAIDADYLKTLVLGYRAIKGKGDVKLYVNQADLLALSKVRGTNEKKALFEIEFDAGTTTSGTIKEGGMAVKFRILDELEAGTQLFGQPQTIDMPMWDNYEIETNEGGELFKKNLIGIRGLQTANANLTAYHGMVVVTQE